MVLTNPVDGLQSMYDTDDDNDQGISRHRAERMMSTNEAAFYDHGFDQVLSISLSYKTTFEDRHDV